MKFSAATTLSTTLALVTAASAANMRASKQSAESSSSALPNIVVVMIDDLGRNQVGYHAQEGGNTEIQTPSIDQHAKEGIRMERGYMTPWCAPSRAAFQTGSMTSFNAEVTNNVYAFDDSIGFVGGLQPGTKTLASALKEFSRAQGGPEYKTSYTGKWGIGGTAWTNTPLAVGYDTFLGYWGDSIESCDGWVPTSSVPGVDGAMMRAVTGYWQQGPHVNNALCDKFQALDNETLSPLEKTVACQSEPVEVTQIIDQDLLNHTKKVIKEHDFSRGPLYHMHATQILHLPMQYPEKYDENMTWYGEDNMPLPDNDMLRLKTANIIKFMDDIFDEIMGSIKEKGDDVWNNTIVLFTTDNGGAIYTNSANNNFPLRGSKLSSFEGGLRVTQFLTGGWLNKTLPSDRSTTSDTYVVVNDWAPTLLGMVGANKTYLLGNVTGNTQGNELWDEIQNSVSQPKSSIDQFPHQMPRNVTFSPRLYMEIEATTARKYIDTGDDKVFFARKWGATWPTNDDIIPDFGYASINPCRPGGKPMQCCYFDIELDPEEDAPLTTNCTAHAEYANQTYFTSHLCETQPHLCLTEVSIPSSRNQSWYDLWALYDASGPFTNAHGDPITSDLLGESRPCVCSALQSGLAANASEGQLPDCFIPTPESPTTCFAKDTLSVLEKTHAIECDGVFARDPYEGDYYESYANEGFEMDLLEPWFEADRTGQLQRLKQVPDVIQLLDSYTTRQGYSSFPNFAKFPFVAAGQDTCAAKGVTPNPLPVLALTPWCVTQGDVTMPSSPDATLCSPYGEKYSFCPSKQNPLQLKITEFDYSANDPSFTLVTNETVNALTHAQCRTQCRGTHRGTAYIGNGPWGLTLGDSNSQAPSMSPSAAPTNSPTASPSASPSNSPSSGSSSPSTAPSNSPSSSPTGSPSYSPSNGSSSPSSSPSEVPTLSPSQAPSDNPTASPTASPSNSPSSGSSEAPTLSPSVAPTNSPTSSPTASSSNSPSSSPTSIPTSGTSASATDIPTV